MSDDECEYCTGCGIAMGCSDPTAYLVCDRAVCADCADDVCYYGEEDCE